jgi:hypothetical protein
VSRRGPGSIRERNGYALGWTQGDSRFPPLLFECATRPSILYPVMDFLGLTDYPVHHGKRLADVILATWKPTEIKKYLHEDPFVQVGHPAFHPCERNAYLRTGLYSVATESLSILLESGLGCRVNDRDLEGKSPLMLALVSLDVPRVELLLDAGADPVFLVKNSNSGYQQVYSRLPTKVVQLLVDRGADPDWFFPGLETSRNPTIPASGRGVGMCWNVETLSEVRQLGPLRSLVEQALHAVNLVKPDKVPHTISAYLNLLLPWEYPLHAILVDSLAMRFQGLVDRCEHCLAFNESGQSNCGKCGGRLYDGLPF